MACENTRASTSTLLEVDDRDTVFRSGGSVFQSLFCHAKSSFSLLPLRMQSGRSENFCSAYERLGCSPSCPSGPGAGGLQRSSGPGWRLGGRDTSSQHRRLASVERVMRQATASSTAEGGNPATIWSVRCQNLVDAEGPEGESLPLFSRYVTPTVDNARLI